MAYLIEESPRMLMPSLAMMVGINEALVLQQVHFLCTQPQSGVVDADGNKWIWNTYETWKEVYFPFWGVRTIQDLFLSLEKKGLLLTTTRLLDKWDNTKFYRVDVEAVRAGIEPEKTTRRGAQEPQSRGDSTVGAGTSSTAHRAEASITQIPEPSYKGTDSLTDSLTDYFTHAGARSEEIPEASGGSDGEDDIQVGDNALNVEDESVLVLSPSSERSEGLEEESPGAGGEAAADRGEYADLFPYPFDQLYHAFEEYFDNQIGLCRITPAQIAFLEPETPLKDLEAWKETIDTYRGNFNAELGRYLPDKFATVIQVFKMHHSRLMRERRETGVTNGQKHILSITDREKEDAAYKAQNKLTAPPKT